MSYQASTFTMVPSMTEVEGPSTIEESALPLKSTETSGSSEKPRMPCNSPSAALRRALLTSSTVATFSVSATRSTRETLGVGTRMASPCILPFNSGRTRPTALAAPVLVGIMDMAAARARRRSVWGRSRICWSLV